MKPGRCLAEQVGVKAPGRPSGMAFLPWKRSSVVAVCMPSLFLSLSEIVGSLSPTLMVIGSSFRVRQEAYCQCNQGCGGGTAKHPKTPDAARSKVPEACFNAYYTDSGPGTSWSAIPFGACGP